MDRTQLTKKLDALDDARADLAHHVKMWRIRIGLIVGSIITFTAAALTVPGRAIEGWEVLVATIGFLSIPVFLLGAIWSVGTAAGTPIRTSPAHPRRRVLLAERAYRDALDAANELP